MAGLLATCGKDQEPLGPDPSERPELSGPAHTLTSNGGCIPEVITTYQGDTETLLFTFSAPQECFSERDFRLKAEIDGTPFGVDFGDGVLTDPDDIQGTVMYWAEQDETYQNLPSPPSLGKAHDNGVYQSIIEFDPPVRSVEFYYSRRSPDHAWWGGQPVIADSMPVYAKSSGFFILDAVTVHSNSTSGSVDTWDSAQLTASGDMITWLWFDGRIFIDDLKITRAAPPALECTAVPRGITTTCEIKIPVDAVTGWRFNAAGIEISSSSTTSTWTGVAVQSGTVFAFVTRDGVPDTLSGSLEVVERIGSEWRWGPGNWDFVQGAGWDCGYSDFVLPDLETPAGVDVAFNTRTASCAAGSIDPNVYDSSFPVDIRAGYNEAQVPPSGPNAGLWYITGANYRMDRGSSRNPYFNSDYQPRITLTGRADLRECRKAMNPGSNDPVDVNWWEYNEICRGVSVDGPEEMFEGIWSHEGYGNPFSISSESNGHQGRREWIASQASHDPYRAVETLVGESELDLEIEVGATVRDVDEDISQFAGDHNFVTGNWSGNIWVYNETTSEFQRESFSW